MKDQRLLLICCIFLAVFLPQSSHACTTFCLDSDDALVVGKNFDKWLSDGLVFVNKRNVSKTAWLNPDSIEEQPVDWTSKYGSITFSAWGQEFPESGMNEAGLVVNLLWEPTATEYPAPDERPAIRANRWIQYQLDNSATVAEVIASDLELRTIKTGGPMHFFVCDSQGHCASIEFLDGILAVHQTAQETMPVKVLANNTYSADLEYWENEEIPVSNVYSSAQRFCTAAELLGDYDPATSGPAVDYTFNVLSNVSGYTQWSIAYNIPNRRINFHTTDIRDLRYINLNSFDFSCMTPVRVLDIHENLSGDVSDSFIDYTYEINRALIEKTLPTVGFPEFTKKVRTDFAGYPETTVCAETCTMDIKHKKIQYAKLSKDKKVVLKITGDEEFDMSSSIDLGPLTWMKESFNRKKNRLKVKAIVPAGLRPGTVPIWAGNCFGEIEVLP